MEQELPDPIHTIQDSRYVEQDYCQLDNISLCSSGNIAASGHRRFQSYVCIYSSSEDNFDSRDEPTLLYHKQFEQKDRYWKERYISFKKTNSTEIVTCRGHEVQVIDYKRDLVLRSRKVNGWPQCLSVSESQIFFGILNPAIVYTYDNDLNRIKSIRLKGIRKDWPCDILAVADRLYVCTIEGRAIEYGQNSGNILTEYTTEQRNSTAKSIAVDTKLQFVAVLWDMKQISFYSFSDNTCLIDFNVETGVSTIRISGGRIVTGKKFSGEIKIYDLGSLLSYSYLKKNLLSRLGEDDCKKLTDFFAMGGEEFNIILSSERPAASFLLALEEKGVIQPSNVDKLEKAFHELKMSPSLYHTVALYKKLRVKWHIGNYVHSLDPIKGTWMTDFKLPGSSLLKKKDVSENEGALQNDEEKRREITSSVPGSSKEFRKYLHTQGTLKRVGSDDGVKTVAVPEKKAKVVLEEPAKSDLTKGARERELRGVSKKSPNDRVEVLDFGEEAVASVVEQRHYAEEKTVKNVVHQFDQENSATVGESFNEDGSVQRVAFDEHSLMSSPGTSKSSTSKGLVEGHLEEHSASTSPREVDTEFPLLETEATLTFDRQQTVTITGTKVELTIPPYALSEDMDKSKVKLRIIPRLNFENPCKGFSSNSAVIVEILPNNTRLKQPAKLRIPHCLLLEENRQHEAKIYMSHHQEGDAPQWEEQFHLSYIVEERSCILFLDKFCWVTMTVGDRNVLGKRVLFYASGKSLDPRRQCAEVAVGYYHNLDGEGEFLQHNKSIVSTKMPYTFLKEGARPLSLRVIQYSSDQWELWPSDETSKVVPFEAINSPFDYTWTLLFKKQMMHSSDLKCKFMALQEQGQHPIELKICLEPLGEGVLEPKSVSECKTMEAKMRTCFLLLKRKLLKTDWKDFGRYLDVQEQHLNVEEGDVSESIYQMLLYWQRTNGIKASPKNLKDALIKVGRSDLIEEVNKIFS